ncbi:PP2C family protein-serine/threonine phosphatase [Curtobacterium caseinilyticum]|uniref:SpoIIE family protein phosphatase n=1 Tax=Curtobacterium caseinilyticum TaxID=3055137 RepID=A0ABT7TPG2_9MICO|nr:GAF domain-containing SpoIIE family protein phosphatase [Curtobacterium caseinilyticum]MDM7891244.1 SpoIIE family protein phosphatase [Curtobacterium caseinilyticum]
MSTGDQARVRGALVAALDVVDAPPAERFERIVRVAREVFDVPLSYVNVLDEDLLHTLTPNVPDEITSGPIGWSFCQLTIQQTEPTVIGDTTADPRTADLPGVTNRGIRFYAGVPLTIAGGEPVGTLCLMDTSPRDFSPQDTAALIDLGRWAERALGQGLHHDRLLEVAGALAPTALTLDGYHVAGITVPYGDLSGDLHDWSVVDGALVLTLADVMGKEQPAALLAAGIRSALRQHRSLDPAAAVAAAEPTLGEDLVRASAFATLFHARLRPATGVVEVVDAGHGLAVHVPADGPPRTLRSHGLPLGLHHEGATRTATSFTLGPGDALVVASDGALDLGDGTIDTLLDLASTLGRARDVDAFLETVRLRAAERAEDDVTVVVLTRSSP